MNKPEAKPIVTLLRPSADRLTMDRLRRSGYCVIVVESHDDIRAAHVIPLPMTTDALLSAAARAIGTSDLATKRFGNLVCNSLLGVKK